MTLSEAKMKFAKDLASLINESKLPPTVVRNVLFDIDNMLAQAEEMQYQKQFENTEEPEQKGE